MGNNWGPRFIVPSQTLKTFSGRVRLRETYDEEVLNRELESLDMAGSAIQATNPWYYRKKGTDTWIKIGESNDRRDNFAVPWDTGRLVDGKYEILGLMHVIARKGEAEVVLARESVAEVTIQN
ncbi:MAG: hypothetical protein KKB20_13985 [Proteobacteria bacterium]|nr:hypothetical protein [Pseudomonadota bacterium]